MARSPAAIPAVDRHCGTVLHLRHQARHEIRAAPRACAGGLVAEPIEKHGVTGKLQAASGA